MSKRKNRRELKQEAVNYKGGKCEACGYDKCLAALSFHHKDPSKKDFGVSDIINMVSKKRLKKELQKTALLCLNCHVEVHEGLLKGYLENEDSDNNI